MIFPYANPWLIIAAILVIVLGAGRLTRIITYDDFPLAVQARIAWDRLTNDGPWSKLAHCFWCAGPWVTLVCLGWLAASLWSLPALIVWFCFWGWLGISYLTSMVVARDEPGE